MVSHTRSVEEMLEQIYDAMEMFHSEGRRWVRQHELASLMGVEASRVLVGCEVLIAYGEIRVMRAGERRTYYRLSAWSPWDFEAHGWGHDE